MKPEFLQIIPVLPSQNIKRNLYWYKKHTGFESVFTDSMYACLKREHLFIHLQWYADTKEGLFWLGGLVFRLFVKNIQPIFKEFMEREVQ